MSIRIPGAVALLVAGTLACAGERGRPSATTTDSPPEASSAVDSTMQLVIRGAAVAIAVDAAPDRADSILAAEGLSAGDYERLMYRIASDSLLSRLFRQALQGR